MSKTSKPKVPLKNRAQTVEMIASAVVGVADLGRLLKLSERRIYQLAQSGVLPQVGKGRFEFGVALDAYISLLQSRDDGEESGPNSMKGHRVRLLAAQADQAELELAKARGLVAPIAEFERAHARTAAEVRANVMNVPSRVVLSLLGETDETRFKKVLRAELADALTHFDKANILEAEEAVDLDRAAEDV